MSNLNNVFFNDKNNIMIHLTREELKDILHSATGNIKDFVTNEDMFIDNWIDSHRVKKNVVLDNVSDCPKCENPYTHLHRDGSRSCEDCNHGWG